MVITLYDIKRKNLFSNGFFLFNRFTICVIVDVLLMKDYMAFAIGQMLRKSR